MSCRESSTWRASRNQAESIDDESCPTYHVPCTYVASATEAGWPDEFVVKNRPKFSPNLYLSRSLHNLNRVKKLSQNVGCFGNFQKTAQSKQSPKGRKFAQSGHPESKELFESLFQSVLQTSEIEFYGRGRVTRLGEVSSVKRLLTYILWSVFGNYIHMYVCMNRSRSILWLLFSTVINMDWATFRAIFSQNHLVTVDLGFFWTKMLSLWPAQETITLDWNTPQQIRLWNWLGQIGQFVRSVKVSLR
jgi:hypothetical protein